MRRRDEVAFIVFSAWTIIGLFIDGWAHGQGKPESFFTPWHGVLYSGFVAGGLWTIAERGRIRRRGEAQPEPDALATAGAVLFAVAGIADMLWHTIFGVEQDLEALLSPSHLLLMVAGVLLTTAPLRGGWPRGRDATLSELAPKVASLAFTAAVASFFLVFANPFVPFAEDIHPAVDAAAVIVTNLILVAPLTWLAVKVSLPRGAALIHLGIVIALVLGLDGFERWPLLAAAVVGGIAGEAARSLTGRPHEPARIAAVAATVSAATWFAFYAARAATSGIDLAAELWTGPIVLAVLGSCAVALLMTTAAPAPTQQLEIAARRS